jgi:DNA-binding transcriptional LysR family regulator
VVLLGASISASTLLDNGIGLISGIAAVVVIAIVLSFAIGSAFGLPRKMAILIACGNSICGNSAIAAVAPVIDADSEDVAAAIAFTAVLGVIVVLVLPELVSLLSFSPVQFGVFAGLTASHPLANAPTVVARDLRDEAFIVPQFSESEGFAENLFGLGRCGRFDAIPRHRVADFITALCMTAAGYGVVLVPQSMKSLAPADVAFCAIADYNEEAELALAYQTRESAPCVRSFVESAIAEFSDKRKASH